ncbi:MAG: hypothetical protein ABUL58_02570 [Steroidobacter sp.]
MNNPAEEQPSQLEQHARGLFDESVASLDARTLSRLNRARQAALDAARKDRVVMPRWLIPAGSVAALALIATFTFQSVHLPSHEEVNAQTTSAMEDMEIMASSEDLDLLQDVDFYDSLDAAATDDEVS